jgi:hypothetical protein
LAFDKNKLSAILGKGPGQADITATLALTKLDPVPPLFPPPREPIPKANPFHGVLVDFDLDAIFFSKKI